MLTASGMAILTLTTDFGTRDGYVGAVSAYGAWKLAELVCGDVHHFVGARHPAVRTEMQTGVATVA